MKLTSVFSCLTVRYSVTICLAASLTVALGLVSVVAHAQEQRHGLVDRLVSLLEKREGDLYWSTVGRLEKLGKEAAPALRSKLDTSSEKARLGCAKALLETGSTSDQEAALEALASLSRKAESQRVRIDAIQIYGQQGDVDDALEVLGDIFEESLDPEVAIPLARALWEIDHVKEARDYLLKLLRSNDLDTRNEAALTLAGIGFYDDGVRDVIRALRREPTTRGRRAELLNEVMRLSRQIDRRIEKGETVLPGTNVQKLLAIKERRINELEESIERMSNAPGAARALSPMDELFEEVISVIRKKYVDPDKTPREKLIAGAIRGMVESLDPFSAYMDARESNEFTQNLDGNYPGIGAHVTKRAGAPLEILRPIYGGPAYRGGILSGDSILSVDGVRTAGLNMDKIMKLLKGRNGTTVEMQVWRRGWTEPKMKTVKRETIEIPSVYYDMLPEGLGYLRLTTFGKTSSVEFAEALEKLAENELRGLVVDLRNNPGGRLSVAVRIVDFFVKNTGLPIVSQKGRNGEGEMPPYYPTAATRTEVPVVVLVNENSASASEIVSGALQDFGRATILGKRTYGKGSVQNIIRLKTKKGSILKLTVQYYFLPLDRCIHTIRDEKGRVIEKGGVSPDVEVDRYDIPLWRLDERNSIRHRKEVLEYVDRHAESLRHLIPYGDLGKPDAYPEDGRLLENLGNTHAQRDDLHAVIRGEMRRRLEDERGRQFAFDLQQDRQLQAAVLEILQLLGQIERPPAYAWIAPLESETVADKEEADKEKEEASDEKKLDASGKEGQ